MHDNTVLIQSCCILYTSIWWWRAEVSFQ